LIISFLIYVHFLLGFKKCNWHTYFVCLFWFFFIQVSLHGLGRSGTD
jgi:hypothetical protein